MSDRRLDPDDELQQWIDDLLRSPEGSVAAPAALGERVVTALRCRRRRSRIWKSTAAAAACVALAALFWQQPTPVSVDRQVEQLATNTAPQIPEIQTQKPATATFTARGDLIAIPIESNDPTVTIVQLYPTTHTRRRQEREATLRALAAQIQSLQKFPNKGG